MLELAETVVRVTRSSSEITFEASPYNLTDDPQVRRPDITRAREVLGWQPEVGLEEGLRRWLESFGREPASV
jgi:dTDP-glucose 4,6-dehydratase